MTSADNLPIIVGIGQSIARWEGEGEAPTPMSLATEAFSNATDNSGVASGLRAAIDWLAFIRLFQDSLPAPAGPFGTYADPPALLAERAGLSLKKAIHSHAGGEQPQSLVNEAAAALWRGEIKAAVIVGSEAIDAVKKARKKKIKLNFRDDRDVTSDDRGKGSNFLTEYEAANGLGSPVQTYATFDHALRARLGLSKQAYRDRAAAMLTKFSSVAESNPYAYFAIERSAAFLAQESAENRAIADPFLRFHVAQDGVNQGAAVILTTVATARELGIDQAKWVYVHGHGEVRDLPVSERPDLSRSKAIELVLDRALNDSGLASADIAYFDLYSCFPSVPFLAAEHLGLDPFDRQLTVTGGLPFFGGPGNNYVTHSIASMVECLRNDPGQFGLVLANGGFMSKEAACIYSTKPPSTFKPTPKDALLDDLERAGRVPIDHDAESLTVEGYTVVEGRSGERFAYVIGKTTNGRALAKVRSGARATMKNLKERDPLGHAFQLTKKRDRNFVMPTDRLGEDSTDEFWNRKFNYVELNRTGNVLEITLNRPERYNALHGPAHYELHEIFDGYEQDPDLWVAILTGAGDKSFCSGNDLKATNEGLDILPASSGFAGLCDRWEREKPVIVAVNGSAMGGGCEIVLASDIAVADPHAKFALPEVKVGLFAAAGGVQRLTRQIGRKAAMDMILTGRSISAARAETLGIINRVAGDGESALGIAREIAGEIVEASPTSVRASKRVLNHLEGEIEGLPQSFERTVSEIRSVMKSNDCKEGVRAFVEKRPPKWTNS